MHVEQNTARLHSGLGQEANKDHTSQWQYHVTLEGLRLELLFVRSVMLAPLFRGAFQR